MVDPTYALIEILCSRFISSGEAIHTDPKAAADTTRTDASVADRSWVAGDTSADLIGSSGIQVPPAQDGTPRPWAGTALRWRPLGGVSDIPSPVPDDGS